MIHKYYDDSRLERRSKRRESRAYVARRRSAPDIGLSLDVDAVLENLSSPETKFKTSNLVNSCLLRASANSRWLPSPPSPSHSLTTTNDSTISTTLFS